ncbi:MAG: mucoidy inhibitor MuiA family protein [Sphingobacteriales bacterium]|nr:MAG: mucoidy inhibitor MuiA family protein [Sphingobacteriales bacterium]
MKIFCLIFSLLFWNITFAQKPIFVNANVKAVTVYFSSAQLTQNTTAILPKGASEIVIKNIANYVNENTIQIAAPATVTVLSVQFTNNYISEFEVDENNPSIKRVRDSILFYQKEIDKIEVDKTSNQKTIEILDKNQQVYGQNSGLNFNELVKLIDFYRLKRSELSNAIISFIEKQAKINLKIAALNTKLEIGTKNEAKTSNGKIILQIMNDVAGKVDFELNYLCPNASWQLFYDLRATSITEPINVMYKAQVSQNTGIDWRKVKLTLSSGNPNQNNTEPTLYPWTLLYNNPQVYLRSKAKIMEQADGLSEIVTGFSKAEASPVPTLYSSVNAQDNENQLNVSFDIDALYDILSNQKAHSVALKEIKLPISYQYFAAPRIDKEAFLMADIIDYAKYNLLPGQANIIFEGMYVGKTNINPNQTNDTLSLSMGRDKKIAIKREKVVDKSGTKFLSTKKEQTFTFDITVKNNKKETINLFLQDQYPLSADKEIEIELLQSDSAEKNIETGILSWEFKLKPSETKKLRISYRVKYNKDKIIDNL